ncbi:hypothetical protein [Streptomyces sp. MB09-02B]|uniref:hypothetical protein n=1 Tax=Streptomyces sp. MB09-02B TaxID=3028667 RepID=UPI0029A47F28|nr:hypothetical protein [Streptomyces sp. MB09-02B]MDX3641339.1 hypothetical protein [Streptomyces sp. MB09-02B]
MAHTAFGGLVALAWLLLPTATQTAAEGYPTGPHATGQPAARVMGPPVGEWPAAAAPGRLVVDPDADGNAAPADDSSGSDLVLPVAAAGTAVAVAAYSLVRRRRRARLRTTPTGVYEPPTTPLSDLHRRARRLLVETDDSIRTSTEELGYAAARPGRAVTEPLGDDPPGQDEAGPPTEGAPDHGAARPHADDTTDRDGAERPTAGPSSHSDAAGRDIEVSDTGEPDADGPDAGQPDADAPDAGQPDADAPEAKKPGADGPEAKKPGADGPEAKKPGADGPEAKKPGADGPEAKKPGADGPEAKKPGADGPEAERPGPGADARKPDADEADEADEADPGKPEAEKPGEEKPSAAGPRGPHQVKAFALDPAQPFAETPATRDAVRPFVEALADARGELVAAFGAGQRLDEESGALTPDEERALLEEILTRCTTAQRRLDTATPAFDQLRSLERDITPALEYAEARFRELTGRTATAATTLTALRDTYARTAALPVTGHVEQAKDRLVFATTELNRARQSAYPGDLDTAAVHLRAAEGAIDQADLFVTGVERLAVELARATEFAKQGAPGTGAYDDPLDVLRRRSRWRLPSRSAVAAAADFITTHRAAVGVRARTRLSEAQRHLGLDDGDPGNSDHARRADTLAQEARDLAEQDVRAYGNPYGGPVGDGLAGALLGGIILGEPPDGTGRADLRGPACYGGTATRARRAMSGQF